jgi:patatin-like phospholipase/acyl hydrolase
VNRRRILAIDGGGMRGLIPAIALAALERSTGQPVRATFDFLAGTSTGAVIAGGLAAGIPADRIVELYRRRGPELFRQTPILSTLRRIVTGQLYDVRRLNEVLLEELGELAGWRVNDVPGDIMVTAVALDDGHPWYFVKDRPGENACTTGSLSVVDCVTASAAAPTYFGPWPIEGIGLLVDGGAGVAGNPVYQACVEAFEYTLAYQPAETVVVSLGTGRFHDRRRPTWLWPWVEWVISELFRSPGEQQTELVARHYGTAPLYRIDVELPRNIPLDAVGRDLAEIGSIATSLAERIDWPAILDGHGGPFRVKPRVRAPLAGEVA